MEEFENGNVKREEATNELEPKNTLDEVSEGSKYTNKDVLDTEVVIESMEPPVATSYSEEHVEATTELVIENEMQSDSAGNAEGKMVVESPDRDAGDSSDVGADHHLVTRENGTRSENSVPVNGDKDYTEDDHNTSTDTENREINQIPISANPTIAQRTSWGGCCGLFQFLTRADG